MRSIALAAALLVAFGSPALAKTASCRDSHGKFTSCTSPVGGVPAAPVAKQCKTGKPCGSSCIAKDKVCHKG